MSAGPTARRSGSGNCSRGSQAASSKRRRSDEGGGCYQRCIGIGIACAGSARHQACPSATALCRSLSAARCRRDRYWREDDESEPALANSPIVIRDEALTAYVKNVLCSAVGADRCNATRVYIMREPSFGASMTANGTMRVYSGLLLRVRSEAELAAVLGHAFGQAPLDSTATRATTSQSSIPRSLRRPLCRRARTSWPPRAPPPCR
jgi:hypothetical protein